MVTDTDTNTTTGAAPATGTPAEEPAAGYNGGTPRGHQARRFTISGDTIARTVADLPDREREGLKWLAGYCVSTNQSHRDVAARLLKEDGEPYHPDSLYQAFTGRREAAQLLPLVGAIERFRLQVEENQAKLETDFIEHALTRKIFAHCDRARERHRLALIYGESQIGKTTALVVYKERHNHGETIYVRMPTRGTLSSLLVELALVLNVPTSLRGVQLRRAIINCFDSRMLLIVDEAHEGNVGALNFCREIWDRRKCGVVLAGTNVLRQTLTTGVDARNFRQLLLRGLPPLLLPAQPGPGELAEFARAYGLGPAGTAESAVLVNYTDDAGKEQKTTVKIAPAELQARVIARDGLGRWCMILQEARELAQAKRRPVTWGGVVAAWHSFERMGSVDGEGRA